VPTSKLPTSEDQNYALREKHRSNIGFIFCFTEKDFLFSSPCSSIKVQVMFLCFAISKYLKSVVTRCTCECISSVLLLPLELKVLVLGKIEVICETRYLSYRIWCLFVFLLLQHVVHIQFQIMVGKPLRYILLSRSY